jgi:hypothetical protein
MPLGARRPAPCAPDGKPLNALRARQRRVCPSARHDIDAPLLVLLLGPTSAASRHAEYDRRLRVSKTGVLRPLQGTPSSTRARRCRSSERSPRRHREEAGGGSAGEPDGVASSCADIDSVERDNRDSPTCWAEPAISACSSRPRRATPTSCRGGAPPVRERGLPRAGVEPRQLMNTIGTVLHDKRLSSGQHTERADRWTRCGRWGDVEPRERTRTRKASAAQRIARLAEADEHRRDNGAGGCAQGSAPLVNAIADLEHGPSTPMRCGVPHTPRARFAGEGAGGRTHLARRVLRRWNEFVGATGWRDLSPLGSAGCAPAPPRSAERGRARDVVEAEMTTPRPSAA